MTKNKEKKELITYHIAVPTREDRDKLRKILKVKAAIMDVPVWKFLLNTFEDNST